MKDVKSKKSLVVVLGMHRSGTSAITRSLQVLGVELGEKLIGPIAGNNEKGFFEDVDINSFNNEILKSIDSDWSYISPITSHQYDKLFEQGFFLRAVELIRDKLQSVDFFAFKDPRIAKLLPFWKQVFSHLGYDIYYVLALRHPLSVAKSLFKRDRLMLTHSYWLWLGHILESLHGSMGKPRLMVNFDSLIQAPREQLLRIAETCQLEIDEEALTLFEESFLDMSLRHTVYEPHDLQIDNACPELVQEVFSRLTDIAADKSSLEDPLLESDLARWSAEFEKNRKTFDCIDQQVNELSILREAAQVNKEQINTFKHEVLCLNELVHEREAQLTGMGELVHEREAQLTSMGELVHEREAQLTSMGELVHEREAQLDTFKHEVACLNELVHEREAQLDTFKHEVACLNELVHEREAQLTVMGELVHEREAQLDTFKHEVACLNELVHEREAQLTVMGELVHEREAQLTVMGELVHERDAQISSLNQWIDEQQTRQASLENEVIVLSNRVEELLKKVYWLKFRGFASRRVRSFWHNLPVSSVTKLKTKRAIFKWFPFVFRHTVAYQTWVNGQSSQNADNKVVNLVDQEFSPTIQTYVPLLQGQPLAQKPVRIICFYLPQFHSFPENDAWWGKGFTEWTNVVPAKPQFFGHYQPHVPGELGYYNLLDPAIQKRQVELAKLYGIEGFCFYFYWFAGHRLMEDPIRNYLDDPTLDLPFCLCWANENWSRRWDGLENDVLIAQNYSPEDDISFISHVADYLKDSRYIRIENKPVLLVYRPNLLPSAKETADRWRKWCRENGVGEIYLAYTQSFESVDPENYGFDAAIEFPPNNMNLPIITDQVKPIVDNFSSNVFDWQEMVHRSQDYHEHGYKLFRGVNPSWDNTARRKNKGNILLNSNPCQYQEWLYNAINHTCTHFTNPDERLVFVNAWNEWAEGAHLEPDQRYGYAYLEATRIALLRSSLGCTDIVANGKNELAIVVHAFYKDVFSELLERFFEIKDVTFKLFVTTPCEQYAEIDQCLKASGLPFYLLAVDNRGRDVLPFLTIMKYVVSENFEYVLKLHTKKSLHREDGDVWCNDLYSKLTSNDAVCFAFNTLKEHVDIGIIAPDGHLVPMDYYWGSNAATVEQLASRLGQSMPVIKKLNFSAGTMFYARAAALQPLFNLAISDSDFEPESGQIDGTFAHALERCISISCHAAGLKVIDTALSEKNEYDKEYTFATVS